jgi:hypothetical protein
LRRSIIAFGLSVLSAAIVGIVVDIILATLLDNAPISLTTFVNPYLNAGFIYLVMTSTAALAIFGIPLTMVLSRCGIERRWSYPAFGVAIGVVVTVLCSLPFFYPADYKSDTFGQLMLIGGSSGSAAGFVWWHLYRKRAFLAERQGA